MPLRQTGMYIHLTRAPSGIVIIDLRNGPRARGARFQLALSVCARLLEQKRIGRATQLELYDITAGQNARPELADRYLDQMPLVVAEPHLRVGR